MDSNWQKDWQQIKEELLRLGGDFIIQPRSEPDLDLLLSEGHDLGEARVKMLDGPNGECHAAAAREQKSRGGVLWTGYALSKDGGWRQHSWIEKDGIILEPTSIRRQRYWGAPQKRRSIKWWQPLGVLLLLALVALTVLWASLGAPLPFPEPAPLST